MPEALWARERAMIERIVLYGALIVLMLPLVLLALKKDE
jgi:hypothetical protein